MRALLVSFVLISLDLLASADPQFKQKPDYFASCGPIYKCYVPEFCTNNEPLATSGVKEVTYRDGSFDNCPAIVRFHLYAENHGIVEMEGLLDDTNSIVFDQQTTSSSATFATFSCEKMPKPPATATELSAKYGQQTPKIIPYDGTSKMKCVFEVKLKPTEKIFLSTGYALQFKINEVATKIDNNNNPGIPPVSCDPTKLNFNDGMEDPRKIYEEVKYDIFSPRKYECSSSIFMMEYQSRDKYQEITMQLVNGVNKYQLTCDGSKFKANGNELPDQDDINVRCAADANLFCKTSVKSNPQDPTSSLKFKPEFIAPNLNSRTASSLKCPSTAPHLIIMDGLDERQIKNPQFECLNYGGIPQWSIDEETFNEEGPEVYCTNEVKCLDTIPESAVIDGELDENFVPTCPGGTLYANKVDKNSLGAKVTKTECDKTIGKYKYTTADGTQHEVVTSTKFICDYPVIENFAQNAKQTETIIKGSIYGVVVAIVVGIIVIAAMCGFAIFKTKSKWKKQRELDMKVWNRYCLDSEEEKDYYDKKEKKNKQNKKKGLPENEEMTAPAEASNWSKFLMSAQYRALAQAAPNGLEFLKEDVTISTEDTLDFDGDDENNIPKAVHYTISYANYTNDAKRPYLNLLKEIGFENKFDQTIKLDSAENFMERKKIPFIEDQKKEGKEKNEKAEGSKKESDDQQEEKQGE